MKKLKAAESSPPLPSWILSLSPYPALALDPHLHPLKLARRPNMWTWGQFNDRNIGITRRISGIWQIGPWKRDALTVFSRLNAPGVYFKLGAMDPAFIRSRRLIGARRLLTRCFSSAILSSWFMITQPLRTSKVGPDGTIFPFILSDKLFL